LITALAGHVPVRGEILVEDGFEFEVTDADPRRVKRVKIRMSESRLPPEHGEDNPGSDARAGQGDSLEK
jgi:Mg2+/Co2+ transporter CorC